MFADAADSAIAPVSDSTALNGAVDSRTTSKGILQEAPEPDNWLASSLEQLEVVHLLPCHIKYSGQAPVSDLFRPHRVKCDVADPVASQKLEVLLHGRWLRGQEHELSCETQATQLRGFVAAAQETRRNLSDLRQSLSAERPADQTAQDCCMESEEPPATVVGLRPYAKFSKLCYWQQDREPSPTDDVQQGIFFLKATTALHDYQDEFDDS